MSHVTVPLGNRENRRIRDLGWAKHGFRSRLLHWNLRELERKPCLSIAKHEISNPQSSLHIYSEQSVRGFEESELSRLILSPPEADKFPFSNYVILDLKYIFVQSFIILGLLILELS